jgi:hypothetical protein
MTSPSPARRVAVRRAIAWIGAALLLGGSLTLALAPSHTVLWSSLLLLGWCAIPEIVVRVVRRRQQDGEAGTEALEVEPAEDVPDALNPAGRQASNRRGVAWFGVGLIVTALIARRSVPEHPALWVTLFVLGASAIPQVGVLQLSEMRRARRLRRAQEENGSR